MRFFMLISAALLLVLVSACGGGSSPTNRAPTASFTPSTTTPEVNDPVELDASASTDPDGDTLTYTWALTPPAASQAELTSPDGPTSSFTADVAGDYQITLVVSDGAEEATATQTITVDPGNRAPTASFTFTPTVAAPGETVNLDATNSSDPDGDALAYAWTLDAPAGSTAQLSSPDGVTSSFVTDVAGTYRVTLVVSEQNGDLDGTVSQEVEAVIGNRAPVASFSLSPENDLNVNDLVTLDASASTDPDGDALTYTWALTPPATSQAELTSLSGPTISFTADVAGDYQVTLVVSDGEADDTTTRTVSASVATAFALAQKLLPQDAIIGSGFGQSVALDGDTIAVGAANVSSPGGDTDRDGVVYVFVRSGEQWQQQAVLSAAGTDQSLFGATVALSGDTLVVGAPTGDGPRSTSGIAFVFTRQSGTWSAPQQIVGTGSGQFDRFGDSVAVDGGTVLVGAPSATVSGAVAAGAVYVFGRSGTQWQQQARLVTSSPVELDQFGTSLALDNDTFVAGAPNVIIDPEDGAPSTGTAYVFTRTADVWSVQAALRLGDSGDNNRFGRAVALSADTLAASAPGTGRVYLYTRSGSDWTLQDDVATGDTTIPGGALSLSSDTLAAGSLIEDRVYLFERQAGQWLEQDRLTPGSATSSYFGRSLALQNGTLVVGAQLDDGVAANAGAAYVYREGPVTTGLPTVARTVSERAQ